MLIKIFAAKVVGLKCLEYLLKNHSEDQYEIVVCEEGSNEIISFLDSCGHDYSLLSEVGVSDLENKEDNHYDWLLNLWGSVIYRPEHIKKARKSLNIHPSYLPYCRGRDPVVWSIRKKLPAGATLHVITEEIDKGPIWHREKYNYYFPCRGIDLYKILIEKCWELFIDKWSFIKDGNMVPVKQELELNENKRVDLYNDREINVSENTEIEEVFLKLLAHDFSPDYTALIKYDNQTYKATLQIEKIDEVK